MSTTKDEALFEVTIAQETVELHEGSGVKMPKKMASLMHREPFVAITAKTAENKAIRELTNGMDDEKADALIDTLKVSVVEVPFPAN